MKDATEIICRESLSAEVERLFSLEINCYVLDKLINFQKFSLLSLILVE